jgi:hypothetical protein
MTRYFFHIDGNRPHRDELGEHLADDDAAWRAAIQHTRDIESNFQPGDTWRLDVHEGGKLVYIVEIVTHRRR